MSILGWFGLARTAPTGLQFGSLQVPDRAPAVARHTPAPTLAPVPPDTAAKAATGTIGAAAPTTKQISCETLSMQITVGGVVHEVPSSIDTIYIGPTKPTDLGEHGYHIPHNTLQLWCVRQPKRAADDSETWMAGSPQALNIVTPNGYENALTPSVVGDDGHDRLRLTVPGTYRVKFWSSASAAKIVITLANATRIATIATPEQ